MRVATEFIDGVPFKHQLPVKALCDAIAEIEVARTYTNGEYARLCKSIKEHNPFLEARYGKSLAEGSDARLASAITANKKLKPRARQTLEWCLKVPSLLDFAKPLSEPVPVYPKPKKSGGFRMIHNPGLLHRTSQDIVVRIMGAYHAPRPFQFTDRGVHAAIKQTKEAAIKGHVHVARLDIKDFYPSFDHEKLVAELPLRKEVVEHIVLGRCMEVVMDPESMKGSSAVSSLPHAPDILLMVARLGIPQGSACSPIVGGYCMSRLAWKPTKSVVLVNYVDDFLLLSKSPKLLDKAIGKLTDAVAKLPGGQFELKLKATRDASKGFDFLGHRLQFVDGKLTTSPMPGNVESFWNRVTPIETKLCNLVFAIGKAGKYDKDQALEYLAQLVAKLDGWLSAFRECDDAKSEVMFLIEEVSGWCTILGVTPDQVAKAIEPWMQPRPSDLTQAY